MASGYVPQMDKLGGLGRGEQREYLVNGRDIRASSSSKPSMTAQYRSELTLEATLNSSRVDADQPKGPAEMEAVTVVWTKNWLILAYSTIMIISFINSLQQQANFTWKPYVTSAFSKHGLTAMTDLVANIVGGISKLPLAKFIDVIGRPHGFMVCLICIVVSLVLMATCESVQTFCAAQVIYWSGMNGVDYVFNIFIADTSLMKNRLIWMSFTGLPYVINTFAGPKLGETFLKHVGWRWGYGFFIILTPIFSLTFWGVFWIMSRRAKKLGVLRPEKSGRTWMGSIKYWCVEFDVVGLVLVCVGFSLLLLPFPLAAYQKYDFASPMFVSMIVIGTPVLGLFAVWERFYARKAFFPFYLMKDRTVIAACLLGANSWIAFYSYRMMYSSYLQVVFRLSVSKAGYITNIFNIVSCTWAIIISFAMKYTDTFRWGALVAVPIQLLMTGMLIYLRTPGSSIAALVVIEVLGAMASAMIYNVEQVAIMVAVPHQEVAVSIALLNVITALGGAIGQAISATIWAQVVPQRIAKYLPEASPAEVARLYGDISTQLGAQWGGREREAVVHAFGDAQKIMVILGTCALVPCLVWATMLKNARMSDHKARRGLQA